MIATFRSPLGATVTLDSGTWHCQDDPALAIALDTLCPSFAQAPNPHGARVHFAIEAFGLELIETDVPAHIDQGRPGDVH